MKTMLVLEAFNKGKGQRIKSVTLRNNELFFEFENGYEMCLFDDGQLCCESRYMTTDDDLAAYSGAVLLGAETADAPSVPDEYGDHEVQFLRVQTDKGVIVAETHNEHNGYYGGFAIVARESQTE